jgi:hypothetical protein
VRSQNQNTARLREWPGFLMRAVRGPPHCRLTIGANLPAINMARGFNTARQFRRIWRRLFDRPAWCLNKIKAGRANPLEGAMRRRSLDESESRRLVWKSRHIPFFTILMVSWAIAGMISTFFTILAMGPDNPIP